MAHSYVMSAGEDLPVFHDFLGIVGQRNDSTEPKSCNFSRIRNADLTGHEADFRGLPNGGKMKTHSPSTSLSEKFDTPLHSASKTGFYKADVDSRHGKRRDSDDGRDAFQQQQRQPETIANAPFLKVSRLEKHGDMKGGHIEASRDSPMQPPRISSNFPNPLVTTSGQVKRDMMQYAHNKWTNSGHVFQNGHSNLMADKVGLNNQESFLIQPPPSDEGSRTGLKGSSVGNLINANQADKVAVPTNSAPAVPATFAQFGRSQSFSQSTTGSESLLGKSQQMKSTTSHQLTIFYGGQAHVFDDVTSDKVEAIMSLARANGRSWSTMYSARPKASLSHTGSEGSLQVLDRERENSVRNGSNVSGFSTLALTAATNGVKKAVTSSNLEQEGRGSTVKNQESRGTGPANLHPSIEVSKEVK